MVKEFVLIERGEYNHLRANLSENVPSRNETAFESNTSLLSISNLTNAVKSRVGIMYHNKVDQLFEFLKTHPAILTWTDFGEAIVQGTHLTGSNVYEMLDYLFHDWRKSSKQTPPQGLDKLIRVLFQNGFDPQNVVNRRLRVFCHANEPCKRTSLVKKKQRATCRRGIKWLIY